MFYVKKTSDNNKLKFDKHIENIYQKAGSKLIRFERLKNYTELPK